MTTTVGQLIVNDCLPPEFRDYTRVLDSGGLETLLQRIAHEKPELYSEITKKLMDVGNDAAFDTGVTLRLSDCETGFDKTPFLKIVADAEAKIENDPKLSPAEKSKALGEVYSQVQSSIEKNVFDSELKKRNQLALQVASKARGTKGQLASFVSTPGSFPDSNGNTVPMFIQHSYAEGLTPAEYWAGSYGTRTSVVQGKIATAKGGAFGKLLSQSANNQVVVEEDCGGVNGVPMPLDDDDNIGSVLAIDTGKYKAGTVITKSVLADLRKDKKLDEVVVRSPMTCGCKNGVCAKCAGIRETGGFPPIGYNLGTNAASAFAERITQGALNCLAEGTLVRMADGSTKPIELIKPGEMVLGCDLNGNVNPTPVVNWYDNGIQPCFETIFRGYDYDVSLKSTNIHKLLCASEKVERFYDENVKRAYGKRFLRENDDIGENVIIPVRDTIHKTHALVIREDGNREYFFSSTSNDIGYKHVYDIEIGTPEHIFLLANGLVVSNTKHSGRLASGAGKFQGFGMFTSMAKVPKSYPDKATLADVDGEVTEIKDAPQGGKYVMIDDGTSVKEHYVPTGYDVLAKPGDKVEAGDQLSDGVINPAELVGYKGIGEARRYWAKRFTQGIRDSGMKGNRRNAEVLAKTLINNVELEEEDPAGLPGDVTTYNKWAFSFKPRPDTKVLKPDAAKGMYLEQPVLHYTIGTRITPSVIKTLAKFGQQKIFANANKPSVVPFMQRVEDSNAARDDWVARLGTTYLKDRLVEDAQRGSVSHLHTTEPNPSLAKGVEFGTWGQPGSKNKSELFTY